MSWVWELTKTLIPGTILGIICGELLVKWINGPFVKWFMNRGKKK